MELAPIVVDRYNNSVHSVKNKRPVDIFFDRTSKINYQGLSDFKRKTLEDVRGLIEHKQTMAGSNLNKNRSRPLEYGPGETVFIRNKQIKTKEKPRFTAEEIQENRVVTIKTKSGKAFHKSDIRS